MHGLMLRAIQTFAQETYGMPVWDRVTRRAAAGIAQFEAMLVYQDDLADRILDALTAEVGSPRATLLEDIGVYLVSAPRVERLRRLMRFAGLSYEDFLHSLEDLPGRARLAVADLVLPRLELRLLAGARYILSVEGTLAGFSYVMTGVLRAMADDYGALVTLDHRGLRQGREEIEITLVDLSFARGRSFELGAGAA